jgi:hypothetical protein
MKMSVLIKKMEIPKGCWACPFAVGKHYECLFTKKSYNWGLTTRPSDCPLIEVQSPHGRLIDANKATEESMKRTGKRLLAIDTAPTIIEAEESDT